MSTSIEAEGFWPLAGMDHLKIKLYNAQKKYQASVNMLKVKVCDSTEEKAIFSLKEHGSKA